MAVLRPLPPPAPGDLPRGFPTRQALGQKLRELFPAAEGELSEIRGGRKAAELALTRLDPSRYRRSRNFLDGAVTGLSPYVRHGVLGLAELKRLVAERLKQDPEMKVYLRADKATPHKQVKSVMGAMAETGVGNFIFGVFSPGGDE